MDPEAALNAACREIFEVIRDVLGSAQDDYELTD